MLTPRLTNALYYTTIPVLLDEIDNTVARIANELYYNVIYSLHRNVACGPLSDLLMYRRILWYKSCNPSYAADFTEEQIAGRVITLMAGITSPPITILTTTTTTTAGLQCTLAGTASVDWSIDCSLCGTAINLSINPKYCTDCSLYGTALNLS
jgi:hypothetical protein